MMQRIADRTIAASFTIFKPLLLIRGICALGLMLLLSGCLENGQPTSGDAGDHLRIGQGYMEQGQYRAAMIEAKNAIQQDSKSVDGYVLLASVYNELGQSKQAIRHLEEIGPSSAPHYTKALAEAYLLRGKYRSALNLLQDNADPLFRGKAEHSVLMARAYLGLGQITETGEWYRRALQQDPDEVMAQLGLARIDANGGDESAAMRRLEQVLVGKPQNIDALVLKGSLLLKSGKLEQAEGALSDALAAMPATDIPTPIKGAILSTLAEILTRQGRSAEALIYSRVLAETFPGAQEIQEQLQQAVVLYKQGELEEAEKLLESIQQQYPGHEESGTLLGVINYLQGDMELANQHLSENIDPETAPPIMKQLFALAQLQLNQSNEVMMLLEDEVSETTDPKILALYGIAAISNGQANNGVRALRKALVLDPGNARLNLVLARYYNNKLDPDLEQALAELRQAFAQQPSDPYVQSTLSRQLLRMRRLAEADEYLQLLRRDFSDQATTYLIGGDFYASTSRPSMAEGEFRRALELAPDDTRAFYGLAQSLLAQQKWQQAQVTLKRLIAIAPEELNAYRGLIQAYDREGRGEEGLAQIQDLSSETSSVAPLIALGEYHARRSNLKDAALYLDQVRSLAVSSPEVQGLTALVGFQQARQALIERRFADARQAAITALQAAPDHSRVLGLLAEVEIQAGQYREAAKIIKEVRKAHPALALADLLDAELALKQSDFANAERSYHEAWAKQPSDIVGIKLLELLRVNTGQEAAASFAIEWERTLTNSAQAKLNLAAILQNSGDEAGAIKYYEAGLGIAPDVPIALNNLAWLYFKHKDPRARSIAAKAVKLAPKNGAILDTYGWILFKEGEAKEAVPLLEEAVTLMPTSVAIKQHLEEARKTL